MATTTPTRRTGTQGGAPPPTASHGALRHSAARAREWWDTPATSYYLLLGAVAVLVVLGLVMVLSSSSVESIATSGSPFSVFARQAVFAALGIPLLWICSRLSVRAWKRLAWPALALGVAFQLTVFTPLGVLVNGNRNWIEVGGMRAQPSEALKVALVIWCAFVLERKAHLLGDWRHVLVPVGLVAGGTLGLVLWGHDLGTGLVIMVLVAAMLFVAGVRIIHFLLVGAVVAAVAVAMVMQSKNRMERVQIWLSGECLDYYGSCWQTMHGQWALASGGWWGLGLGASREKWSWLPEAHNDFIFAIIGEELGLPGTLLVLVLFAAVAVAGLRVVRRHDDVFVKIATAGVIAWVLGQAMINIGVVVGLMPVIGLPLPLVSSGGSALVATMAALGMVLSFARAEPGADDALAARAAVVRRSLAVVGSRARPVRRRARR